MPDSTLETVKHIREVQSLLWEMCAYLAERGRMHDATKFYEPELSGFDAMTEELSGLKYPSPEYSAALAAHRPTIEHHYAHNDHHPEFHTEGIAGMSLLSVVEMLCDWKAASQRTKQGSIVASLAHNKTRFSIDDQLYSILENTVNELGW